MRRHLIALLPVGIVLYWSHVTIDAAAFVAFVSTIPWIAACSPQLLPARTAILMFALLVYGIALACTEWLGAVSTAGWLISTLFYVPLFLPTFVLGRWVLTVLPDLPVSFSWPMAFTAGEWLRIRFSPGEVPFGQLGQSLVAFPSLLQSSDLAGGWVLSFLASSAAAGIAAVAWHGIGRDLSGRRTAGANRAKLLRELATPVALFASSAAYGYWQLDTEFLSDGPRVHVVQTNLTGWSRDKSQADDRLQAAIDLTRRNLPTSVDLLVWPENSFMVWHTANTPDAERALAQLRSLSRDAHAPLVADGAWFPAGDTEEHHTVTVVYPDGTIAQADKQLLVPWSEYVPFRSQLNALSPGLGTRFEQFVRERNPFLSSIATGETGVPLFEVDPQERGGSSFLVPICYEILSARLMNAWYRQATDLSIRRLFVVNVVNERLLGTSVHRQTLGFSRLRAVEGRVSIVRATNNGISAVVGPDGQVRHTLPEATGAAGIDQTGAFSGLVVFDKRFPTVYARWGDYLPVSCLLVIGMASGLRIRRRYAERPAAEQLRDTSRTSRSTNGDRPS